MSSSLNRSQSEAARAAFPGRLAGTVQVLFALLIGGVSALASQSSPDFLPRGQVLLAIYALPGIVGLLGVTQRRPALLLAAAAASAVGSVLAFSGVTLIFLVPAVLFLVGAVRLASTESGSPGRGVAGVLAGAGIAATLIALMIGAGASAFLVTDERCWTTYETPGGIRYEPAPWSTGEMEVPQGALSSSCSTGVLSARGIGLGGLLGSGAVALAVATRRRPISAGEERATA
jgi:hypothetical protein